jgi:peptide/nickel transport system ATP-binding protein
VNALLDIRALSVAAQRKAGPVGLVDAVSLAIAPGEIICLAGESGSGKSLTALSVMRLAEYRGAALVQGEIRFEGRDLARLSQAEMSALRGRRIGLISQEPMAAFDPLFPIGAQIAEVLVRHLGLGRAQARARGVELLARVKVPDPAVRAAQYPHELSGGLLQRALIALALACDPALLIADEPTTALDVTIQAQILDLLKEISADSNLSVLLITHDLGAASRIADHVAVMYAGRIAESGPAAAILARPVHPYTQGLLRAVINETSTQGGRLHAIPGSMPAAHEFPAGCRFHPRCAQSSARCATERPPLTLAGETEVACWHQQILPPIATVPAAPACATPAQKPVLVQAERLTRHYQLHGASAKILRAVDDVSLSINEGEVFGLVGESGSGKSTLARLLLQIEPPTSGKVLFAGEDLARLAPSALRRARRDMQMIFQDPAGSLDPRWRIGESIAEPLRIYDVDNATGRHARVAELLRQVGLDAGWAGRLPHRLSGGQRQRVAIARAIALRPRFIVADEAVSALDVSVRAQIVNLLQDIKTALGLTFLFIGHDLALMRHISDRIGIMYLGRLVEIGPANEAFRAPAHPYTRGLIASIPVIGQAPRAALLAGELPSATNPPPGCRFHTRCPLATPRCRDEEPVLTAQGGGRAVACHFPL